MNAISLLNVSKKYENFELYIDHLDIKQGYITGFIGENGSGKSTTMKIILDAVMEDSGTVEVLGHKKDNDFYLVKSQIGFVGEHCGYPDNSYPDDIKQAISPFYATWDEELYQKYISQFNIPVKNKIKSLSTGQRKMFALIMVLSYHPKLLLLDEPTSGLDPVVRSDVLNILREVMLDEETTVFYSTHITSDLEKTSDYIVYLHQGKIKLDCERNALSEQYCIVKGANELLTDKLMPLFESVHRTANGFSALCSNRSIISEIIGNQAIIENATLEDIMVFAARGEVYHG